MTVIVSIKTRKNKKPVRKLQNTHFFLRFEKSSLPSVQTFLGNLFSCNFFSPIAFSRIIFFWIFILGKIRENYRTPFNLTIFWKINFVWTFGKKRKFYKRKTAHEYFPPKRGKFTIFSKVQKFLKKHKWAWFLSFFYLALKSQLFFGLKKISLFFL